MAYSLSLSVVWHVQLKADHTRGQSQEASLSLETCHQAFIYLCTSIFWCTAVKSNFKTWCIFCIYISSIRSTQDTWSNVFQDFTWVLRAKEYLPFVYGSMTLSRNEGALGTYPLSGYWWFLAIWCSYRTTLKGTYSVLTSPSPVWKVSSLLCSHHHEVSCEPFCGGGCWKETDLSPFVMGTPSVKTAKHL